MKSYAGKILNLCMYLFSLIWFIPLLWMIWTAFRPKQLALTGPTVLDFTWENFVNAWQAAPFTIYFINTLIIVSGIFCVQLLTVTMAAFAFARVPFAGKTALFFCFLVQIMIPNDVLIFPNYMVLKELGLLDTKLGIMIPYFASSFGVFLLRQAFLSIPVELEEAAVMEGYSKWRILWNLYFPLCRPVYIAFGLVSVSYHWNNFLWPLIVTNSVENRPVTVGLAMLGKTMETGAMWTEVSAATLIVIAPLLAAFLLFQRQFINSFIHSGIK